MFHRYFTSSLCFFINHAVIIRAFWQWFRMLTFYSIYTLFLWVILFPKLQHFVRNPTYLDNAWIKFPSDSFYFLASSSTKNEEEVAWASPLKLHWSILRTCLLSSDNAWMASCPERRNQTKINIIFFERVNTLKAILLCSMYIQNALDSPTAAQQRNGICIISRRCVAKSDIRRRVL